MPKLKLYLVHFATDVAVLAYNLEEAEACVKSFSGEMTRDPTVMIHEPISEMALPMGEVWCDLLPHEIEPPSIRRLLAAKAKPAEILEALREPEELKKRARAAKAQARAARPKALGKGTIGRKGKQ